jgi:hypothetical protein
MILGRHQPQHPEDREDVKERSPSLVEDMPGGVVERRLSDTASTGNGPRPIPQHLLDQLRTYPRLRDLVVGYLVVQERIAKYEQIMSDLDAAGDSPNRQFFASLHRQLSNDEGLRSDFPRALLEDEQFNRSVVVFDDEHRKSQTAARAGRNPHQSAQSAAETAYAAVSAVHEAAQDLAQDCKAEARNLLEELHATVHKIFADEGNAPAGPRAPAAPQRSSDSSRPEASDSLVQTTRMSTKPLQRDMSPADDVQAHVRAKEEV